MLELSQDIHSVISDPLAVQSKPSTPQTAAGVKVVLCTVPEAHFPQTCQMLQLN